MHSSNSSWAQFYPVSVQSHSGNDRTLYVDGFASIRGQAAFDDGRDDGGGDRTFFTTKHRNTEDFLLLGVLCVAVVNLPFHTK